MQAITPVMGGPASKPVIEHRISWYRDGNRLGLTPGHDPSPARTEEEAAGIEQTDRNIQRCFGCHTTSGAPGVFCQSCHGDGAEHRSRPMAANIRRDRSVALCASCHRSPDGTFTSPTPELEDERSIRFAPVGFLASRCYKRSKNFSCVDCHNPHGEPAARTVDQVCASCHAKSARAKCPRTPGCATCHMPRSSPMAGLTFTDHRIR